MIWLNQNCWMKQQLSAKVLKVMDEIWQPPATVHLFTGIAYAASKRVWPTTEDTNFGHLKDNQIKERQLYMLLTFKQKQG